MNIRVLGRGCTKCNLTEEIIRQVLLEEHIDVKFEKVTGAKQIALYGVFLTPALPIDGEVKCVGRIPKMEKIKAWISK